MFTSARAGLFATRFRVGVANTHQPPYATMLKPSLAVLLQCRVWHAGPQLSQHLHHFRGIPVGLRADRFITTTAGWEVQNKETYWQTRFQVSICLFIWHFPPGGSCDNDPICRSRKVVL